MPITRYCWRCDCRIPFLTRDDWVVIAAAMAQDRAEIPIRRAEGKPLSLDTLWKKTLQAYAALTGFTETNINALWHHQDWLLGHDCVTCGKPYRTPQARYCVACGDGIERIQGSA